MKRFMNCALVALAMLGTVSFVSAEESAAQATCPIAAGMEKLPKLAYMVGEESICCAEMAKAKAKETNAKLVYVVGTKKFDSEATAYAGLVEETEKFVDQFSKPQVCKVSGNISIGGQECSCSVMAGEVAQKVKKAMDAVAVSYKVGDKACNCPIEAKATAKSAGLKLQYVVNNECTECEHTARLNVAKAKYHAALTAIATPSDAAATN
jgi:hypothetical protein